MVDVRSLQDCPECICDIADAGYAAIMGSMSADLIFATVLIMLSGLFSGLNLGLMSFAEEDLRIVIEGSPDINERSNAAKILPLRKHGNLLLCTLLLGNTLVNAMIAILLAGMSSGIMGGLITTAVIVVFGEIIPQSVCSRHALYIGAKVSSAQAAAHGAQTKRL